MLSYSLSNHSTRKRKKEKVCFWNHELLVQNLEWWTMNWTSSFKMCELNFEPVHVESELSQHWLCFSLIHQYGNLKNQALLQQRVLCLHSDWNILYAGADDGSVFSLKMKVSVLPYGLCRCRLRALFHRSVFVTKMNLLRHVYTACWLRVDSYCPVFTRQLTTCFFFPTSCACLILNNANK